MLNFLPVHWSPCTWRCFFSFETTHEPSRLDQSTVLNSYLDVTPSSMTKVHVRQRTGDVCGDHFGARPKVDSNSDGSSSNPNTPVRRLAMTLIPIYEGVRNIAKTIHQYPPYPREYIFSRSPSSSISLDFPRRQQDQSKNDLLDRHKLSPHMTSPASDTIVNWDQFRRTPSHFLRFNMNL